MTTSHSLSPPPKGAYSRRAALRLGGGAIIAIVVAGCGGDDGDDGDDTEPSSALDLEQAVTEFTIVAENIEWDLKRVVVPAGQEVTATIENRDRGIPHNLHLKSSGDPKTELEDGPVTQTLRFTIDEAGSYEFVCDAHPKMTGTIEAI